MRSRNACCTETKTGQEIGVFPASHRKTDSKIALTPHEISCAASGGATQKKLPSEALFAMQATDTYSSTAVPREETHAESRGSPRQIRPLFQWLRFHLP